tara:strand:+ start:48284 stop:49372 length:1089 start_codon:yes stop_codon:yes gene_type:complete
MNNIKIKVIQTSSEFNLLEEEWKALESSLNHSNITSSFDWLNTWWKIFKDVNNNKIGYDKKLIVICLYDNDLLISVAPFLKVYRKKFGIKISFIEFLGQQWAGNYIDIISHKKHAANNEAVFCWLYKNIKFDIILLKYIPEFSAHFNNDDLYLYSACPEIKISAYNSHEEFIKNEYSKGLKQNLRTAYNRAKKTGIEIQTSVEVIDQKNFKEIINISAFKLADGKWSLYEDRNKSLFMEQITNRMASNVVLVRLNNKNVAYRTNIFFNQNKFCIDASYDRNFRKFELGSISVDANIKDSYSKQILTHCLGPGLDVYKKKFTKKTIKIFIYLRKGNTLMSLLLFNPIKVITLRKEKEAKQLIK